MTISVIISTYNHPKWLEKVLWGYECQSHKDFNIIIADDGSGEETKMVITQFLESSTLKISHCWHEDKGFQKTKILNKALAEARGDYLLITDGDCIPQPNFLETHLEHAEKGFFLSGGYCKLPMELSRTISEEDIKEGRPFELSWMKSQGLRGLSQKLKIGLTGRLAEMADKLTPTKPTWNGMNSSGFKEDILAVNGFNEEMRYGGLDRELGERLLNLGLKPKQIRHRAICLHLDHERGYKDEETLRFNRARRQEVIEQNIIRCKNGIEMLERDS